MKLPSGGGWQSVSLTADNAYHLIDLGDSGEGVIESADNGDVKLAVFRLIGATVARWRHGGSSEDFGTTAAEVAAFTHIFVPVDSSDQVSIAINAGTIEFGGYWISSEADNSGTTEIDMSAGDSTSPTASGRDYDLNSIGGLPAAQSVVVFHIGSTSFSEQTIQIRANGASTPGNAQALRRTGHSLISETDSAGVVTVYTNGSDALWTTAIFNVSAWITDNFIADSTPSEIVPSSFLAWVEMDDPDSDADDIAIILESTHTSNRTYVRGFRNTDESITPEAGNFYTNYASFLAHLDGSQHTDMYLDDNRMHYWRRVSFQAPAGGPTVQAIAGSITAAGSLVKVPAKAIAGSSTPAGSLLKLPAKIIAGSITAAGVVSTVVSGVLALAGSITVAGALVKVPAKAIAGSVTPGGALVKVPAKILAGAVSLAGALVKLPAKILSGSITPAGAVSTAAVALLVLAGSITVAGALVKVPAKAIAGSVTPSGALLKSATIGISTSLTVTGSMIKQVTKILSGSLTLAGALTTGTPGTATKVFTLNGRAKSVYTGITGRAKSIYTNITGRI